MDGGAGEVDNTLQNSAVEGEPLPEHRPLEVHISGHTGVSERRLALERRCPVVGAGTVRPEVCAGVEAGTGEFGSLDELAVAEIDSGAEAGTVEVRVGVKLGVPEIGATLENGRAKGSVAVEGRFGEDSVALEFDAITKVRRVGEVGSGKQNLSLEGGLW